MIRRIRKSVLVLCLSMLLAAWALPGQVLAVERSDEFRLEGKTAESVIVQERHYRVGEATSIVDQWGQSIDLNELAVPSQVVMTYELRMDRDPLVLEIRVEDTFLDSRTSWRPEQD